MNEIFQYDTITSEYEGKYQSRGSKFYAFLFPMSDLPELDSRIQLLKQDHIKARHFCYAYRILETGRLREYCSDAGEPGGSSGPPILAVLKQHDLVNVGCVVVRYFGGTKLGIPGLIEAYGEATRDSVKAANVVRRERLYDYRLNMPMKLQPHFVNAIKRAGYALNDEAYTSEYSVTISIPLSQQDTAIPVLLRRISDRDYDEVDDQLDYLGIRLEDKGETPT